MENTNNQPVGGGVYMSPNLKKRSVVLTKDGQEIEVETPQEKARVIREQRNK
jgi:hypothetical protein